MMIDPSTMGPSMSTKQAVIPVLVDLYNRTLGTSTVENSPSSRQWDEAAASAGGGVSTLWADEAVESSSTGGADGGGGGVTL